MSLKRIKKEPIDTNHPCSYCGHDVMRHLPFLIMRGTSKPGFCHKDDCSCKIWNDEGDLTLREELDRIILKNIVFVIQDKNKSKRYTNSYHRNILDEIELMIARYYKFNHRVERNDTNI